MLYLHNDSTQINSGCVDGGPILHVVKGNILGFFNGVPLPAEARLQEKVISRASSSQHK